jgi:hypothetical protein
MFNPEDETLISSTVFNAIGRSFSFALTVTPVTMAFVFP